MYLLSFFERQTRQFEHQTVWDKKNRVGNIKTIFAPQFLEINPYQKQLAEHLVNLGIQVEGVDSRKIFLPTAVTQWSPNILHLHWLHTYFQGVNETKSLLKLVRFLSGLVILRLMGVKIVWTVHNLKFHENLYPLLDQTCSFVVAKLAHAIIAHCEAAKCEIATTLHFKNKDKIFVVPHGNYTDYYENKIDRVEARKALNIPKSSLVFLFLGLIRPYKGVFELLEAFKQLHSDEVQLVIAGKTWNNELAEQIRQKTKGNENINFIPGFVPQDQIQVYMNACDVVVFPYRNVLTSGAVILAMSFGRACIAPRMGCMGEILDNSGAFLYDPDLEESLSQAMKCAIQRQTELLHMGEHNRQVADQWSWSRVAEMTLKVYQQCLSY